MTDKQIIIDGVDVAGCKYFNKFRNICRNKNLCCDCGKNPNCYYKQLARKTQECENWKETANQYAKNEEYYRSQVDKRKAENEKAEQKLILIRDFITDVQIRSSAASVCDKILQIIDEVSDDRQEQ